MKIAVNARFLDKPFTGIGQYTRHLFVELAKLMPESKFEMLVPDKVDIKLPKNMKQVVISEKRRGIAGVKKTWWEQVQLPEYIKKGDFDLVFFPYPANPWPKDFYRKGPKVVVTVHDCIPWVDKRYRRGLLSTLYHRRTRDAVKKADLVLTVSESSKKELKKVCKVKKVEVIHNDSAPVYKKKRASKRGDYLLYCGGYDVRKNVETLMREFKKVHQAHPDLRLVLAGGKVLNDKLYASYDELFGDAVERTGFVDEKELAKLYAGCLAFVHLSDMEGFNLPVLEAASCGAPLILSDIGVHRELFGKAAQFFDGELEANVKKVLKDGEKWSKKSLKMAENFSWNKSARLLKDMIS